jgi:hypothetical protein
MTVKPYGLLFRQERYLFIAGRKKRELNRELFISWNPKAKFVVSHKTIAIEKSFYWGHALQYVIYWNSLKIS